MCCDQLVGGDLIVKAGYTFIRLGDIAIFSRQYLTCSLMLVVFVCTLNCPLLGRHCDAIVFCLTYRDMQRDIMAILEKRSVQFFRVFD